MEKVAALEKAVGNLSEPQKKALYERLKDKKTQDPVGRQLHYRLSHHPAKAGQLSTVDQVLSALKPSPDKKAAVAPSTDATGLRPGESISAKVTKRSDGLNFEFGRPVSKEQAAAIIFQNGKVPSDAKLVQGPGNSWLVHIPNDIDAI